MNLDTALIIPHLSKELNLIGHHPLPYTVEKERKGNKIKQSNEEYKIVFDSKLMLRSLINVCFELVKQIKVTGAEDNCVLDKVNFENLKLDKQLRSSKVEIEKYINEISGLKWTIQQLNEKVKSLEQKIKDYKILQKNLDQKMQAKEELFKHILRKNETDIFELHKAIWKQFNIADKNYFPQNFKLIHSNEPDFNKLWSTVKYSEAKSREDALKKAVCIFQNNNKSLMEQNFFLKTTLLMTLREIWSTVKELGDKLSLPELVLSSNEISDIFVTVEEFDSHAYNKILNKYLMVVKRLCKLIHKASFTVANDIFICWSKIIEEFKTFYLS